MIKNFVYSLVCGICGEEYVGESGRLFRVRMREHYLSVMHCTSEHAMGLTMPKNMQIWTGQSSHSSVNWLGDARILLTENFGSRLKLNIGNPLLIFNWWGQGNIMWIGKFNWMYLIPFSKLEIIKKFQVSGFLCSVPAVYLLVHPTFGIFGGSRIWGDLFT